GRSGRFVAPTTAWRSRPRSTSPTEGIAQMPPAMPSGPPSSLAVVRHPDPDGQRSLAVAGVAIAGAAATHVLPERSRSGRGYRHVEVYVRGCGADGSVRGAVWSRDRVRPLRSCDLDVRGRAAPLCVCGCLGLGL